MSLRLNVLCVEHDPAEREALRGYGEILGWSITFAIRADRALDLIAAGTFDAIVVDNMLADGGALEVVRSVQALTGPSRPIPILLTVGAYPEDRALGALGLPVDAIVSKPLLLSSFKNEILRLVAKHSGTQRSSKLGELPRPGCFS